MPPTTSEQSKINETLVYSIFGRKRVGGGFSFLGDIMCYSGKCKYEHRSGDCTIWNECGSMYPDNAFCVEIDKYIDLHNEIRLIIEDYIGHGDGMKECVDQIIKHVKREPNNMYVKAKLDFNTVGKWLSAALDDPKVCDEMKEDIRLWMDETHKYL
jgi:hypothetical protein